MNSSIEIAEAAKLAQKLVDRTAEGKLPWEAAGALSMAMVSPESAFSATRFATRLEPNLKATVGKNGSDHLVFSLIENVESSGAGSPLAIPFLREKSLIDITVEADPPYGYGSPQEKHLTGLLVDLYGLARRSALKIDTSVEKALSYLDRIAG